MKTRNSMFCREEEEEVDEMCTREKNNPLIVIYPNC